MTSCDILKASSEAGVSYTALISWQVLATDMFGALFMEICTIKLISLSLEKEILVRNHHLH